MVEIRSTGRKRFSTEQVIAKLRETDPGAPGLSGGATIGHVCQQVQISE